MANEENRVISHIRAQMKSAHWLLEETISDVSDEMGRFAPPGKALPIGAAYVHYVSEEDWMIHSLFQGVAPLMAGPWAGRTGVSEPQPGPGDDWATRFAAWSRRVRVDLPAFRAYAKAVYEATDALPCHPRGLGTITGGGPVRDGDGDADGRIRPGQRAARPCVLPLRRDLGRERDTGEERVSVLTKHEQRL